MQMPQAQGGSWTGIRTGASQPNAIQLVEQLEAQTSMLQALHEVALAAGTTHDAASIAQLVVERAQRLLGVDEARMYWHDLAEDVLRPLADSAQEARLERSTTRGRGILEIAFQRRE